MIKVLEFISRVLVGSLFIVSGLIKANDPLGFSYKLEEYFAADVLNLPFFEPWALQLAIIICVVEIVLGVAVLLGSKIKLVSWSLLLMIIFFTFLTFYSAYFNKVTDCGCFGDALKFTPWQSFTKDVILFFFIAIIFIRQKHITPNIKREDLFYFGFSLFFVALFSVMVISWNFPIIFAIITFGVVYALKNMVKLPASDWIIAGAATVLSFGYSWYCVEHLPVRDFRPYAEGKSIVDGMKSCEELGLPCPKFGYNYSLKNNSTGEEKVLSDKEYLSSGIWEDSNWEIVETSEPITIEAGYEPPVHDFNLSDVDGFEVTEDILTAEKIVLVIAYDIDKTDEGSQADLNTLLEQVQAQNIPVYGLSASNYESTDAFRHKHQIMYPYLSGDAIMLKTVIRSNPGIVVLNKGTVTGKWHYNDIPDLVDLNLN